MITGDEGGVFQRSMPPIDWDCGPIPVECFNKSLSKDEIQEILRPVYFEESRVEKLANSKHGLDILLAKAALEYFIEADSETIWNANKLDINK